MYTLNDTDGPCTDPHAATCAHRPVCGTPAPRPNHFDTRSDAIMTAHEVAHAEGLLVRSAWHTEPSTPAHVTVLPFATKPGFQVAYWNGSFYETPDTI